MPPRSAPTSAGRPAFAVLSSLPEDLKQTALHQAMPDLSLGRLARAAKRFRNELIEELERRCLAAAKARIGAAVLPVLPGSFVWTLAPTGDDSEKWVLQETTQETYTDDTVKVHTTRAYTEGVTTTSVEYGYVVKTSAEWVRVDADTHGMDRETREETWQNAERHRVWRTTYSIRHCVYFCPRQLLEGAFLPDARHGEDNRAKSLADRLGIRNHVLYDTHFVDGDPANVYTLTRAPKLHMNTSPNEQLHSRCLGGSVYHLATTSVRSVPGRTATVEAVVGSSTSADVTFETEFGTVTAKTHLHFGPSEANECLDVIHHVMGDACVVRRKPRSALWHGFEADHQPQAAPRSSYLDEEGKHRRTLRMRWGNIHLTKRPTPKSMPYRFNTSVVHVPDK
jgi:hypothetical protein